MASSVFIWPGLFSFSGTVGAIDALAFDRANQDVYLARVGTQDLGIYAGGVNGVGGTLRFDISAVAASLAVPLLSASGTIGAPGMAFVAQPTLGWYRASANNLAAGSNGTSAAINVSSSSGVTTASNLAYGFSSTTDATGGVDTQIIRASAGNVQLPALTLTAKATSYNNIVTSGWGTPAIYASGRTVGAVNATVGSVSAYTVGAADGSFLVTANVNVTAVTAAAMTVTCAYTDETNTGRTLTLAFTQLTGATLLTSITNVTGTGPYEGFPFHIRCKAATTITFATAGTVTGITYNVEGIALQLA